MDQRVVSIEGFIAVVQHVRIQRYTAIQGRRPHPFGAPIGRPGRPHPRADARLNRSSLRPTRYGTSKPSADSLDRSGDATRDHSESRAGAIYQQHEKYERFQMAIMDQAGGLLEDGTSTDLHIVGPGHRIQPQECSIPVISIDLQHGSIIARGAYRTTSGSRHRAEIKLSIRSIERDLGPSPFSSSRTSQPPQTAPLHRRPRQNIGQTASSTASS